MSFRAGEQINHYTLLEPLGEGGQGSVWRVRDPRGGGVDRALKLVSLAETGGSAFARARREAQILARASHPALVACHGFFEEPNGVVGLLLDLVPGRSLADALDDGRLDRESGQAVLWHLADALAYVHGEGLVHRDIKPENIILTPAFWEGSGQLGGQAGSVKLVDFGIAAAAEGATELTAPRGVIGTIAYLAPEVVDPASWGRTEGATRDVFAFGILGYRLLLGRHPTGLGFTAEMIDYARAYKAAEAGRIAWPPLGVEGRWGAVLGACLALRPMDRLADGASLVEMARTGAPSQRRLGTVTSSPTSAYTEIPRSAPTETWRPASSAGTKTVAAGPLPAAMAPPAARPRAWSALLLVGVIGAGVGALAFWYANRTPVDPPDPPPMAVNPTPMPTRTPVPGPLLVAGVDPCRNPALPFDARDTTFACPVCAGSAPALHPRDGWVRLHGVSWPQSPPMPRPELPKKLCAQLPPGGPPICVPFAELPDRGGSLPRIRASSSDINEGRIYFSIRDPDNTVVAKGFAHRRSTPFRESALCHGFVLVLDDPAVIISVFLDDR